MHEDEKAHEDEEALHEDEADEPAPFDEDPPIAPDRPQVGNSKATFFVPGDDEAGEQDAEEGTGEESGPSRG